MPGPGRISLDIILIVDAATPQSALLANIVHRKKKTMRQIGLDPVQDQKSRNCGVLCYHVSTSTALDGLLTYVDARAKSMGAARRRTFLPVWGWSGSISVDMTLLLASTDMGNHRTVCKWPGPSSLHVCIYCRRYKCMSLKRTSYTDSNFDHSLHSIVIPECSQK